MLKPLAFDLHVGPVEGRSDVEQGAAGHVGQIEPAVVGLHVAQQGAHLLDRGDHPIGSAGDGVELGPGGGPQGGIGVSTLEQQAAAEQDLTQGQLDFVGHGRGLQAGAQLGPEQLQCRGVLVLQPPHQIGKGGGHAGQLHGRARRQVGCERLVGCSQRLGRAEAQQFHGRQQPADQLPVEQQGASQRQQSQQQGECALLLAAHQGGVLTERRDQQPVQPLGPSPGQGFEVVGLPVEADPAAPLAVASGDGSLVGPQPAAAGLPHEEPAGRGLAERVGQLVDPHALAGVAGVHQGELRIRTGHDQAIGFNDQGHALLVRPELLQPAAQLAQHEVDADHAQERAAPIAHRFVVRDRNHLGFALPLVDRAPGGAAGLDRVGVPGLLMKGGHALPHLQQGTPFTMGAQGIDPKTPPPQGARAVLVEHQPSALKALDPQKTAGAASPVDVTHRIELHLAPEAQPQLVEIVELQHSLADGQHVFAVDGLGRAQPHRQGG